MQSTAAAAAPAKGAEPAQRGGGKFASAITVQGAADKAKIFDARR